MPRGARDRDGNRSFRRWPNCFRSDCWAGEAGRVGEAGRAGGGLDGRGGGRLLGRRVDAPPWDKEPGSAVGLCGKRRFEALARGGLGRCRALEGEELCYKIYEQDMDRCKRLRKEHQRSCRSKAMDRYAKCLRFCDE